MKNLPHDPVELGAYPSPLGSGAMPTPLGDSDTAVLVVLVPGGPLSPS